ncbi:MAG TPA: class I SAM-dependent methyltransferase [Anaerolineales bacterium]|nr:class I SAM-dependent methyltransferase [Anaerolineales bacterium]
MDAETAERLIELNRDFYTRFGDYFSATRQRIQPGVRHALDRLDGDESVLDLGCGNGELARELAKRGHQGPYLGLDSSMPLLREAELLPEGFPAKFLRAELSQLSTNQMIEGNRRWDVVTAFAVLHHMPSTEIRLNILRTVRELLAEDGQFILSNWQFLNSEKLSARIQDWSKAGLTANDVDRGDYLLDWRSGGEGLRYVHHFSEAELSALAQAARFTICDTFYSDGEGGNLGLYQIWEID